MSTEKRLPLENSVTSVGTAAMLLALTRTMADEDDIKQMVGKKGYRFVVTEVGGKSSFAEFQEKTTRAVMGACLNNGLITKTVANMHALLHAVEEAKRGVLVNASTNTSLATKIAIVRDSNWIAVAIFGESAIHPMTNHERAGLGVMHLCNCDSSNSAKDNPE
ncbi:HutP family protein [Pelosinus fermentans]|uniref:Hut operon positive regulatory protein n=1 Tax=Pelosinus fermentans JBW45 TaxID=1192197 RepID=I8TUI4_9FIRM|nr:HutP family protein [Pelosinus fermentans]AJQ26741.1 HutP family protein [Pelosinus fermentans JBW45]